MDKIKYTIGGLVALLIIIVVIRRYILFFMWSDLAHLTTQNQINVFIVTGIILWFSTLAHEFGHWIAANITAYRIRKDSDFLQVKPIAKIVSFYYLYGRVESPVYEFLSQNRAKYKGLIRINAASGHAISLIYWIISIIAFSIIGSNYFILSAFMLHHIVIVCFDFFGYKTFLANHKTTSKVTGGSDMVGIFRPDKFIYIKTESRDTRKDLLMSIGFAFVNILSAVLLFIFFSQLFK